jgi:hypothetical protein
VPDGIQREQMPATRRQHGGRRRGVGGLRAAGNKFSGEVTWVQIDLGDDAADADHFLTAEERLKVAMARQ